MSNQQLKYYIVINEGAQFSTLFHMLIQEKYKNPGFSSHSNIDIIRRRLNDSSYRKIKEFFETHKVTDLFEFHRVPDLFISIPELTIELRDIEKRVFLLKSLIKTKNTEYGYISTKGIKELSPQKVITTIFDTVFNRN